MVPVAPIDLTSKVAPIVVRDPVIAVDVGLFAAALIVSATLVNPKLQAYLF